MRFTAKARLETWAHASRVQSDEEMFDMTWRGEVEDGSGLNGLVPSKAELEQERREVAYNQRIEDELRWYARLMKLAHELAMEGRGQEAQDLRVAATHARNYRWLRDHSAPERDAYYLCSDRTQARFNDPTWVDRHIETDIANFEAASRAKSA